MPPVPSPCTRQCCLDAQDVCLGCGRHLQEILRWHDADDAERQRIAATAEGRRRLRAETAGSAPRDWKLPPE